MKYCIYVAAILLASLSASATCSGSGTAWSCTAGTTPAQVNTALGSATDGATITFANGAYSWGGTVIGFVGTKAATLICATVGSCTVSTSSRTIDLPTGSSTKLFRISGFAFSLGGNQLMWTCPGGGCTNVVTQMRIDHNTFTYTGTGDILTIGENTAKQYVYGVVDHNTVNCTVSCYFVEWINTTGSFDPAPPSPPLGTVNNLFFEDNTITIATLTNNGTGCSDHWGGSAIVWRHNTSTNCRVISHGVLHGGGPSNFEIYSNHIAMNSNAAGELDCYRCIHHQGSNTMIVFNNVLTSPSAMSSTPIEFLHYRSWTSGQECDGTNGGGFPDGNRAPTGTWHGYPCFRQPGRDVTGAYKPMYEWNDTGNGSKINLDYGDPGGSPDFSSTHIVQNREYYISVGGVQTNSSSPFNGTTGVGFGTLANRPTTCTTSSESAFGGAAGVGYFATDQGTQGTLYTCSAPNVWTVYYVPYPYPHPLVAGGAIPAAIPTFNPVAGTYAGYQAIALSTTTGGAVICWNTTGSPATNGTSGCTNGSLYSAPLPIGVSTTIFAVAGGTGFADSSVASAIYTINPGPPGPPTNLTGSVN